VGSIIADAGLKQIDAPQTDVGVITVNGALDTLRVRSYSELNVTNAPKITETGKP
jgi:hypothetical protein